VQNRLRFAKVIDGSLLARFYGPQCICKTFRLRIKEVKTQRDVWKV